MRKRAHQHRRPLQGTGASGVEATVRNSVAYVDSTGEPSFMEEVYRRFRDAPVPVVPRADSTASLGTSLPPSRLPASEVR
jgi:hypothetical protein